MTPEYLRQVLRNLQGWWQPGKVVGLIGGEPTLHSQFDELCRVFREEWNPDYHVALGREPIADFNAFATERLFDRSNGRGLWTSFGPRFMDHAEAIFDTFSHWNPNDHSQGGLHQTGLVDAREAMKALGIPFDLFPKYRDECWVQNTWSAGITPKGNYFCEHAATLDLLYNDGKNAWPDEPGWWKRTPAEFGEQLKLCEMCSLCLPGPSQVDAKDRDILSPNHVERLKEVGSPAVKGGRYDLYNIQLLEEQRTIKTKDNYVGESGIRVAPDNKYVRPKKLSCVVVCVGRAEHLAKTLSHNVPLFDEIVVVTTGDDQATADVVIGYRDRDLYKDDDGTLCGAHDVRVKLVCSNRCYEDSHAFNKGKMLNDGLAALTKPDWIVLTDADVFLHQKLREFVMGHTLNPGVLYGSYRNQQNGDWVSSPQAFIGPAATGVNAEPNGYFQLFHRNAQSLRGRLFIVGKNGIQAGPMCENFCSAGGIDSWFMQQFPPDKRVIIPEIPVVHLAHGDFGSGWNGDLRPGWRQWGMYTLGGFIKTDQRNGAAVKRIKLTDTLHGDTWEGPPMKAPLESTGKRLVFQGKDIGHHHVHVAYWNEAE